MFRRFLSGMIFGAGFSLSLVLICTVYMRFFWGDIAYYSLDNLNYMDSGYFEDQVEGVPEIREGFLGATGSTWNGFQGDSNKMLSAGPGFIKGTVMGGDSPVEGLRLRIALNGDVMSQWAITDVNGSYAIPVPYGNYRLDGYELDHNGANRLLAGFLLRDSYSYRDKIFEVNASEIGEGMRFDFVRPVIKDDFPRRFSVHDPVILSWMPYDGASYYVVYLYERDSGNSLARRRSVFSWSDGVSVEGTSIDLRGYTDELKLGYFYNFSVVAFDQSDEMISRTDDNLMGYDFTIE